MERKELKTEITKAFGAKIEKFLTELQRILIDDMITAFENRLNLLKRANL